MMNPYGVDPEAPEPTPEDRAFHRTLFIADLHADTLNWARDPLHRSLFGHVDVPRLMDGNVALQVFTIVTRSPVVLPWNNCVTPRAPDRAALLALLHGRPVFDVRDRAYARVERFKEAAARSLEEEGPELRLIETAADLRQLVEDRAAGQAVVGGILGVEGAHWIASDATPEDVRREVQDLFEAGVRLFAPVHRFDNSLGGSNEGCERDGLTAQGRIALSEAESLGMGVDLAHLSHAGIRDALDLLQQPFTISHTGIQSECEPPCRVARNLSEEELEAIVNAEGLLGVGFWPQAVGPSVWRIIDIMAHVAEMAEALDLEPSRYAAYGSDYDGSVTPLVEVGHLDVLTAIMRHRSEPFSADWARDFAGRNACRFFGTVLPGGNSEVAAEICDGAVSTTALRALEAPAEAEE
ncbi:dipeptidase [Aquibaculum sediminis]|uniref:dipeptidase n=1 Tax=Aquibaculum sediminis TaxID=3231907 RepID=UPI0034518AF1